MTVYGDLTSRLDRDARWRVVLAWVNILSFLVAATLAFVVVGLSTHVTQVHNDLIRNRIVSCGNARALHLPSADTDVCREVLQR